MSLDLVPALLQFRSGSLQILKCPDRSNSSAEWRKVPQVALPVRQLQIERKPKCCLQAKLPRLALEPKMMNKVHTAMSEPKET